jgi:hypothetical protein
MAVASFFVNYKIRTSSDFHLNCSTLSNEISCHITMHPKTADKLSTIMLKDKRSLESRPSRSKSSLIERKKRRTSQAIQYLVHYYTIDGPLENVPPAMARSCIVLVLPDAISSGLAFEGFDPIRLTAGPLVAFKCYSNFLDARSCS